MNNFHERELIYLDSSQDQSRRELHKFLKDNGFKSIDDFYVLDRKGRVPPWQSRTLISIDIANSNDSIYETEEDIEDGKPQDWRRLKIACLLASLPKECLPLFTNTIGKISEHFDLRISFLGQEATLESLEFELHRLANEVEVAFFPCGSEELAIAIQNEYKYVMTQ